MLQDFLAGRSEISAELGRTSDAPPSEVGGFQSLLTARQGNLPGNGGRRLQDVPARESGEGPQIELVQENGVVKKIVVTCICCQRIELDCEY